MLAGLGAAGLRRYAPLGLRVGISFFEIYGAELFDLLRARQKLVVRSTAKPKPKPCRAAEGRAGWLAGRMSEHVEHRQPASRQYYRYHSV